MLTESNTGCFSHFAALFSHNINELIQQMCRSTTGPGLSEGTHIRTHLIKGRRVTRMIKSNERKHRQKYDVRRHKPI